MEYAGTFAVSDWDPAHVLSVLLLDDVVRDVRSTVVLRRPPAKHAAGFVHIVDLQRSFWCGWDIQHGDFDRGLVPPVDVGGRQRVITGILTLSVAELQLDVVVFGNELDP